MIPVVSHEECKKKYSRYDSKAHLCAGQGHASGSGGCQGDSGGPLVCEKHGTWYLHGAVSFGKRGCPTKSNTVFARITTYLPWIMDKLGKRKGVKRVKVNDDVGKAFTIKILTKN